MTTSMHTANHNAPASNGGSIKSDVSAVRDDLADLKSDTAQLAVTAKDTAMETVKSFRDSATQCHASACDTVRSRPTTSVLVALGVGVLVGKMLGGK